VPAVQAKAKAINVQLSDLPGTGWKPHVSNSKGSTPRCSYYEPDQSDLTENGDADSPEFTLASGSFVSSSTGIFVSAKQGRADALKEATDCSVHVATKDFLGLLPQPFQELLHDLARRPALVGADEPNSNTQLTHGERGG